MTQLGQGLGLTKNSVKDSQHKTVISSTDKISTPNEV